ncbi:MAG: tetratricopeptide repeat protein [Chloroflexota bacterium]
MSYRYSSYSTRRRPGFWSVIFTGAVAVLLLWLAAGFIGYLVDQNNYQAGFQAYQAADCVTAVGYFDRVLAGRRPVDFHGYEEVAETTKAECQAYQAGLDNQNNNVYGAALLNYANFARDRGDSPLMAAVRSNTAALFAQAPVSELAEEAICRRLDELSQAGLIPDEPTYLPPLYVACGQVLAESASIRAAYDLYVAFLTTFPDHALAKEAEVGLLANRVSCSKVDELRQNPAIGGRPDFLPYLYFSCAEWRQEKNEPDEALALLTRFLTEYPAHALAGQVEAVVWENPAACQEIESFKMEEALAGRPDFLPTLYSRCAETAASAQTSFDLYVALLNEYPDHDLAATAEAGLLDLAMTCDKVPTLKQNRAIAERPGFLPDLYDTCAQRYLASGDTLAALDTYKTYLAEYPDDERAREALEAFITDPVVCWDPDILAGLELSEEPDFFPNLYYNCGRQFAEDLLYASAITMYERFLQEYPDHARAEEVQAALAQALIENARQMGAGEIAPPSYSGWAAGGTTVVVIQNDSPESLRIVFSGPESRIETLEACETCTTYFIAPMFCPEQGPTGRYTLAPGYYDVLVESISDSGTTPWTGEWELVDGDEYYSCFIIVTSFGP